MAAQQITKSEVRHLTQELHAKDAELRAKDVELHELKDERSAGVHHKDARGVGGVSAEAGDT